MRFACSYAGEQFCGDVLGEAPTAATCGWVDCDSVPNYDARDLETSFGRDPELFSEDFLDQDGEVKFAC